MEGSIGSNEKLNREKVVIRTNNMSSQTSPEEVRIISGIIGGGLLGAAVAGSSGAVAGAIVGIIIVKLTE